MPAEIAPRKSLRNAAMNIVASRLVVDLILSALFIATKTMQGTNMPIMPMLSTLAPTAVSSPSSKSSACETRITVTERHPA